RRSIGPVFHSSIWPSPHHYQPVIFLFFHAPAPTEIYTLSLHDALPICVQHAAIASALTSLGLSISMPRLSSVRAVAKWPPPAIRSEEHTSELQSLRHLVCRLLLEKKKNGRLNFHTLERSSRQLPLSDTP